MASEDPYLTGRVGAAYARGFEHDPTAPAWLLGVLTIKHWAAYQVEEGRGGYEMIM